MIEEWKRSQGLADGEDESTQAEADGDDSAVEEPQTPSSARSRGGPAGPPLAAESLRTAQGAGGAAAGGRPAHGARALTRVRLPPPVCSRPPCACVSSRDVCLPALILPCPARADAAPGRSGEEEAGTTSWVPRVSNPGRAGEKGDWEQTVMPAGVCHQAPRILPWRESTAIAI